MKKLLIVDDDAPIRRFLVATFQHEYVVFEAADGISALSLVENEQPDLIILDGKLPRLDGLAVLVAIKQDPKTAHILVMMMTGRSQLEDLERGMDLGADAYFIKPVSPARLRAWAREHLERGKKSPIRPE